MKLSKQKITKYIKQNALPGTCETALFTGELFDDNMNGDHDYDLEERVVNYMKRKGYLVQPTKGSLWVLSHTY